MSAFGCSITTMPYSPHLKKTNQQHLATILENKNVQCTAEYECVLSIKY
jgi:hypothetical protein